MNLDDRRGSDRVQVASAQGAAGRRHRGARNVEVADLTLDSREVAAGRRFSPAAATITTDSSARGGGRRRARRALGTAPGVSLRHCRASVLAVAVPGFHAQPGLIADRVLRCALSAPPDGLHHRHQRQDHLRLAARAALDAGGRRSAYLGTLGAGFPGDRSPAHADHARRRDPAPAARATARVGATTVAMEVSSHALAQERCAGLRFQVAFHQPEPRSPGLSRRPGATGPRRPTVRVADPERPSHQLDDPLGRELATRAPPRARLFVTDGQ